MNLEELALLERQSKVPELSSQNVWLKALVIYLVQNGLFDPMQINELLQKFDTAKSTMDRRNAEIKEKQDREHEEKIVKIMKKVDKEIKENYCYQLRSGETFEIDADFEWFHVMGTISVFTGEKTIPVEPHCPKAGQKISLKGSLDNFEREIAIEVLNGKLYPSLVELDRKISKLDPLVLRCGAISAEDCPNFRSVYDGGSIRCYRMELKLVPK